jgi:hypothetical protein
MDWADASHIGNPMGVSLRFSPAESSALCHLRCTGYQVASHSCTCYSGREQGCHDSTTRVRLNEAILTLPPTHSLRGAANAFGTQANSLRGVANAFGTQAKVGGFLRSPQRDMATPPTERKGVVKTPLDSSCRQSPKVLLTCARVASWVFHQG